jgi:hypothetical protein
MTENLCKQCGRRKCDTAEGHRLFFAEFLADEASARHEQNCCHGNCAPPPVAEPRLCAIPLDGPSAMHSEMAEHGDLEQHIKERHAQEAPPVTPPPASEASDLTRLIERVESAPSMTTYIANGVPVKMRHLYLRDDDAAVHVLALRVLRVLQAEDRGSVDYYNGEIEFWPRNSGGPITFDDAERLLGIGGGK